MFHSTAASHSTNQASSGVKPQRKHIPGPLWPTAAWNTIRFARQALSFVQELRERYGDLVTLPTMLGPWTLVFHPDDVRHVVQENHKNYRKGGISNHVL